MKPSPLGILMVAFHFPPIASAGTHRSLNFARELDERGHRIGVVTARSFRGMALDRGLLKRVPGSVSVRRAWHVDPFLLLHRMRRALRARNGNGSDRTEYSEPRSSGRSGTADRVIDYLSRLADVPDRYASWIPGAVLQGVIEARRIGADVIYTTAPPFSAHVVGLALADVLGLPWIADLRDPWATNPFRHNPFASLTRLDQILEEAVVRRASRVILNTELAEECYRTRYPDVRAFRTITNGIDGELLGRPSGTVHVNGTIDLLHSGTIYGRRSPHGLLAALARLRVAHPEMYARLRVVQLGAVENRDGLLSEAQALGIADRLLLAPAVSHAEAFERLQTAPGLLLLGVSGENPEVQVPAKLFEYLAARRPILALAKPRGAIARTLERARAPYLRADPDDPDEICAALQRFASRATAAAPGTTGSGEDALQALSYPALAKDLERELLAVTGRGGSG